MSAPGPAPLLQTPGRLFEDLCRDLGGDLHVWRETEDLENVTAPVGFQCTVGTASQAAPTILRCIEGYGHALTGSLEVPGLPDGSLPLSADLQPDQLTGFLGKLKPGITLDVTLAIGKQRLLEQELGATALAGSRTVLFFFRQTLENLFLNPTEALESTELWPPGPDPVRKIFLLAPEWNGFLDGPYLAVLGGDPGAALPRLQNAAARRNPFTVAPEKVFQEGHDNLRWETGSGWPRFLTPLHLLVDGEHPAGDPVAQALLLHRTNLCLLFSADRTLRTASTLRAIYSGGQKRAEIDFVPMDAAMPAQEDRKKGVEELEQMVGWAYADRLTVDRLTYLQTEIATALRGLPGSTIPFDELLRHAGNIRKDLDLRWRAFIEKKIDAFSAEVRALENDAASTAQAFSDQTSTMIRKLSDNMLAAVAVVLGTFVATSLGKGDPALLRLGLLFYLVYLLVFPVGYDLIERRRSFATLCRHFGERRERFENGLGRDKVDQIANEPLRRSIRRFHTWFGVTLGTYLTVAAVLWMLIPPPFPSNPYNPPKAPELPPANEDLRAAHVFAQGQVIGAEDVAVDRAGRLYTGTADGRVARVTLRPDGTADVLTFARTGGRPFGLRFDPAGNLIVAVANKGLVSIDPTGKTTVLVSKVHGVPLGFMNTLDIARDGKIYFSESAPGYSPTRYIDELLESRPRGRLLVYDPKAPEKVLVLLENLFFSNGVALTTDQRAVLVAETYAYRIRRYWLDGPKKGTWDVFAENLPGFPDNLTSDRRGGYWLALPTVRKALLDKIHPHPFLKEQLVKLPRALWPKAVPYGLVVVFDENGRIPRSLHDPGGKTVRGVTTARPAGDKIYLGSFEEEWLAVAPLTAVSR